MEADRVYAHHPVYLNGSDSELEVLTAADVPEDATSVSVGALTKSLAEGCFAIDVRPNRVYEGAPRPKPPFPIRAHIIWGIWGTNFGKF